MGRLVILCLAVGGLSLDNCLDEPTGPQPDKPIRPPGSGEVTPPPEPGPPPAPTPAPTAAPAQPAQPEQPKCPKDAAPLVVAKVHPVPKDKKKRVKLELSGKPNGAPILFKKLGKGETADDVEVGGATFSALVPAKTSLTLVIQCSWEDRTVTVNVDGKSAQVKEVLPPPEPGFANLNLEPGLKVFEGGKDLGVTTPVRSLQLSPGKHQLELKPKKGKARSITVEIKSGETTAVNEKITPKRK